MLYSTFNTVKLSLYSLVCLGKKGIKLLTTKLGQYDRPRILGCKPVEGVLVVLSSNQINIATFVHQMVDTHLPGCLLATRLARTTYLILYE